MTETDVRYAFERATEEISPSPDLLDRVRAGGRRRQIRRRTVLAAGLAAVAGGAGLPLALRRGADRDLPATRGDLAGDRQLLARIRTAWLDNAGEPGEPHILWVGRTPAGPVALVSAPTEIGLPDGPTDRLGFVATVDGRLRFSGHVSLIPAGTLAPVALLAGAQRDVLVVAGLGRKIQFSADYRFDDLGRIERRFEDLPSGPDDVLVRTVPGQDDHVRFALMQEGDDPEVTLFYTDEQRAAAMNSMPGRQDRRLAGSILAWDKATEAELLRWDVTSRPGYDDDQFGYHSWQGPTAWWIRGQAPDGRRLVVQTVALDGRARLFVLLGTAGARPVPRYLGLLGPRVSTEIRDEVGGPLHVLHVRLPDQQGVVVAAPEATFRYRVRGGGWLPTEGDAVLIPDAATELEVRPRRGRMATVRLP